MLRKRQYEPVLDFPVSEVYHNEKRIPLFDTFKPWLIAMVIVIAIAYTPALIDANKNPGPDAPRFNPDNPAPIEVSKTVK